MTNDKYTLWPSIVGNRYHVRIDTPKLEQSRIRRHTCDIYLLKVVASPYWQWNVKSLVNFYKLLGYNLRNNWMKLLLQFRGMWKKNFLQKSFYVENFELDDTMCLELVLCIATSSKLNGRKSRFFLDKLRHMFLPNWEFFFFLILAINFGIIPWISFPTSPIQNAKLFWYFAGSWTTLWMGP